MPRIFQNCCLLTFQYFVFDFFCHQDIFFDKVIKLSVSMQANKQIQLSETTYKPMHFFSKVMHSKIMKSYCVGTFKIDVGTIYAQPGKHIDVCTVACYLFFSYDDTVYLRIRFGLA